MAVLLIAASAVVAGARSYAAIGQWARSAPQQALARCGARLVTSLNVRIAPFAATIRRIIAGACPGGLADLAGEDPGQAESVAADGKSARGGPVTSCGSRAAGCTREVTAVDGSAGGVPLWVSSRESGCVSVSGKAAWRDA